jgi:hypothetical protein
MASVPASVPPTAAAFAGAFVPAALPGFRHDADVRVKVRGLRAHDDHAAGNWAQLHVLQRGPLRSRAARHRRGTSGR